MTAEPVRANHPMSASEQTFHTRYGPDIHQCTAPSRQTGDRCGQIAIHGGTVCHWHGGAAPQVKARANLRLLELIDPAIARLAKIVESGSEAQAVKAANSILDRAGMVRRTDMDPGAAQALLLQRLASLRDGHQVVDGEVVTSELEAD